MPFPSFDPNSAYLSAQLSDKPVVVFKLIWQDQRHDFSS